MASGIFAVAPYVGFLAPVAALSLGLPFIIGGAIFSIAAIALSAVVINKNNTISEKDAVVQAQEQRISEQKTRLAGKEAEMQAQKQENSELKTQLAEKNKELKDKDTVISYLDAQSVKKEAEMQEQL